MNDNKKTDKNFGIINLAGIDLLREKIESIEPLLKIKLHDVRRKWWHFGFWKPAMNSICRHNNKVFETHLPNNILLSVDVAYRMALHMTTIGNVTDRLIDSLDALHQQLFKLQEQLEQTQSALARYKTQRAAVDQALQSKMEDDAMSLAVTLATLALFPNPFTFASAAKQAAEIATGIHYEPYQQALNSLDAAISSAISTIALIKERKIQAVDYIDKTNDALVDMHNKKDPVLQNYGLVMDDRGVFLLKRGAWHVLNWDVSFEKSKNDETPRPDRTPANIFQIAVLEVGVRPNISHSTQFNRYPNRPALNLSFLHRRTTQYLCGIRNRRFIADDARFIEMKHFARGSLGRVGHTDTGRFVAGAFGAKRWSPPTPR